MPGARGGRGDTEENGLCERARTWQRRRLCGTSSACSIATPHATGVQPAAIIPLSTHNSSASRPSSSSPGRPPAPRLSRAAVLLLLLFLPCSCLSPLLLSSVVFCSIMLLFFFFFFVSALFCRYFLVLNLSSWLKAHVQCRSSSGTVQKPGSYEQHFEIRTAGSEAEKTRDNAEQEAAARSFPDLICC